MKKGANTSSGGLNVSTITPIFTMLSRALEDINNFPMLDDKITDEELGLEPVNRVLPDTWKNISWVITNGF